MKNKTERLEEIYYVEICTREPKNELSNNDEAIVVSVTSSR